MALATQCPQCLTIFRVANDQLKLRGGLVRCGSCKNVFNGNEYLVEAGISDGLYHPAPGSRALPPGSVGPSASSSPISPISPISPATPVAPNAPHSQAALPEVNVPAPSVPLAAPAPEAAASSPLVTATAPDVDAPIALTPGPRVFRSPDSPDYIPDLSTPLKAGRLAEEADFPLPQTASTDAGEAVTTAAVDAAAGEADEPAIEEPAPNDDAPGEDAPAAALDDLDFVRKAERRARLGHITQIIMMVLAAIMVPVLLLQATYYWRNQIAAGAPALRPMLNGMCATFHCTVGLPAEIDQLSLESNELQVVPPNQNIYALSLVLRNRSAQAQAWPAIELTLNNDDEKPVVRRVFRPNEYLAGAAQIDNGLGAASEQAVRLTFELDNALVSGYRIYLFYP